MSCSITDLVADLRARKANVRCSEMRRILTDLGFTITVGKVENHKIVTHSNLADFMSTSYDCGHGKDSLIKPQYVGKMARVLSDCTKDLLVYLEKQK